MESQTAASPECVSEDIASDDRPPKKLNAGETLTASVDARLPWNSTGVLIENGRRYRLEVTHFADWRDANIAATPGEGWLGGWKVIGWLAKWRARYPNAAMYTLIGAIQKSDQHMFFVGERVELSAPAEGSLYVFANDWCGRYDNNSGCLELAITRIAE